MGISKGASPAQIIEIIESLRDSIVDITTTEFKDMVVSKYNEIFFKTSKDTIIANIREDAILKFQEDRVIIKLPQDNSKVDFMAVKIMDGVVDFRIAQQKGNNASFNSTSLAKTLECLKDFKTTNKITDYFDLLPDDLNPNKNGLPYNVDVVIGMFLACGETQMKGVRVLTNDDYLRYLGIFTKDICELDYWVFKQFKNRNHEYSAIDKCCNFDTIYTKCINILLHDGN